jgi:mRNA interferase RelE/StbE
LPKVEWTEQAFADLQKLDPPVQKRLLAKIGWISGHFNAITPEPLSGELEGAFKIRAGDWRIIYTLEKNVIVIQALGHRKEIYRY